MEKIGGVGLNILNLKRKKVAFGDLEIKEKTILDNVG